MAGEIKVGMKFGSYNQMTDKLKRKYVTESGTDNPKLETEYIFLKHNGKQVKGNAYREALQFDKYGNSKYIDAVLFHKGYQYGTYDNTWENLNNFDYIQGKSQYALDFNGNGKVDANEIFDGNIDRQAYKKAKESGDLNNYPKFYSQYKY